MTNANIQEITFPDTHSEKDKLTYSLKNIIGIFFVECEDLLKNLDDSLQAVSKGEGDKDVIEIIFHSIHSIHEGASALDFKDMEKFARVFDCALNKMCTNQLEMTHAVFQVLLQSSNMLNDIFKASRDNQEYDREQAALLIQQLKDCIKSQNDDSLLNLSNEVPTAEEINFQPIKLDFDFCNTPLPD